MPCNMSTCAALTRLVSSQRLPDRCIAIPEEIESDAVVPQAHPQGDRGELVRWPVDQMHREQFEYMHYDSKVISSQRFPGRRIANNLNTDFALASLISPQLLPARCIASNLSTRTALARLVLSSGFRADALQATQVHVLRW
jgi:hypothetical protein